MKSITEKSYKIEIIRDLGSIPDPYPIATDLFTSHIGYPYSKLLHLLSKG